MSLTLFALGTLTGAFVHAGLVERRARHDLRVLCFLEAHEEAHGLDLIEARLGRRGTIYIHLARLEAEGLIDSRPGIEDARRLYRLAEAGKAALVVERARGKEADG